MVLVGFYQSPKSQYTDWNTGQTDQKTTDLAPYLVARENCTTPNPNSLSSNPRTTSQIWCKLFSTVGSSRRRIGAMVAGEEEQKAPTRSSIKSHIAFNNYPKWKDKVSMDLCWKFANTLFLLIHDHLNLYLILRIFFPLTTLLLGWNVQIVVD